MTLCDDSEDVLAHASFTHVPNHLDKFGTVLDPADWDAYVKANFECVAPPDSARSSAAGKRSAQGGRGGALGGKGRVAPKKPFIEMQKVSPLSGAFLHYFVVRDDVKPALALREALRTLFANVFDTHFVFLIVPMDVNLRMFPYTRNTFSSHVMHIIRPKLLITSLQMRQLIFKASHFRDLFVQLDVQQTVKRLPDFNLWVSPRELFMRSLYIRNAKYF